MDFIHHSQFTSLFGEIRRLIDDSRRRAAVAVNAELTMLYWDIGQQIRTYVLNDRRADYGRQVINQLSEQMTREYNKGWAAQHLRHCLRIVETFPDREIVYALRRQLSWTHFRTVIYLEDPLRTPRS